MRRDETQGCAGALGSLVRELMEGERLVVGQEVGTMAYRVHDTITAAGIGIVGSGNPTGGVHEQQLHP